MTTTTARRPRRDALENRAGIITAAQSVLASDPNASLDAIAHAAGLSRRALYGHFPDREALLRAVIEVGAERFNAIAEHVDHPDARVALARLAADLWRAAATVQASANIALDAAHVADTVRALGPLRARVRDLVARGRSAGSFRRDVPPELLGFLIEETARATLRELPADTADAASVVVRVVLSVSGLSWTDQAALLAAHPEIVEER